MSKPIICEKCKKPITGKDRAGLSVEQLLTRAGARHYRCLDLAEKIELEEKALGEAAAEVRQTVEQGAAARRRLEAHRKRLASLRKQQAELDDLPKPTNGHRPQEKEDD